MQNGSIFEQKMVHMDHRKHPEIWYFNVYCDTLTFKVLVPRFDSQNWFPEKQNGTKMVTKKFEWSVGQLFEGFRKNGPHIRKLHVNMYKLDQSSKKSNSDTMISVFLRNRPK